MTYVLDQHQREIEILCRRYGVLRLDLFGSATTSEFDPQHSDFDFLVDFVANVEQDLFHRYFDLKEALEQLLGRKVDLVMVGAMKNPYFIESANRTRQNVYAAEVTQAA